MHVMSRDRSVINKIVDGYHKIEPCIIAAAALRHNIYLEALHGVGKTVLGKTLGRAIDETGKGFRFYSADKAGLIDIGGFPDLSKAEKTGEFSFMKTDRSVFGAKVIVIDELARANSERMNYWMEVLEERMFQGREINYEMAIATGNPTTYANSRKMDAALKSRFLFWLPCEDYNSIESGEVQDMIRLNLEGGRDMVAISDEIKETIKLTREEYAKLQANDDIREQLGTFLGTFIQHLKERISHDSELKDSFDAWISPREFCYQLPIAMLGLCAYFRSQGYHNPLQLAGEYAIRYNVETRHAEAGPKFLEICNQAWRQLSGMLVEGVNTPEGKLHYKFASAISARQKVAFLKENIASVAGLLDDGEVNRMTGDALRQCSEEDVAQVGPLWKILKDEPKTQHVAGQVRGFVITEIARVLMHGSHADCENNDLRVLASKYGESDILVSRQVSEILAVSGKIN